MKLHEKAILSEDGSVLGQRHFTQPPPRYTEATLVKRMEELGIGRPSTYASIITTIQDREYVRKDKGRLMPEDKGRLVTAFLENYFRKYVAYDFTADLEEKLDKISEGDADWVAVLSDFYGPFKETLARAEVEMRDVKREEIPTDIDCEKCGKQMMIKWGKMGQFLACSGYPECKSTKDFRKTVDGKIEVVEEETTDEVCDKCGQGMVIKRGRFGRFLACSCPPSVRATS